MANEDEDKPTGGLTGFLRGFTDLMKRLDEVAETGEQISKTGSFDVGPRMGGKGGKGVFGFTVNVGLPGQEMKVEPFGNLRRDEETGESLMEETREPLVDVFDEDDRVLVVAELPGVDEEDIHLELADHSLRLSAEHGEHKYEKQIEVPAGLHPERFTVSCRNGIAEITCPKG